MPKEIKRSAKEIRKHVNFQEKIEFLKGEKKKENKKDRQQRKEEGRRAQKVWNEGRF